MELLKAEQKKDLPTTLGFFTEDSVIQAPEGPQVQGLDGVRGFLEEMFQPQEL